jgi:hypothetical protein
MAKKFITLKCRKNHRLFLDDILKVYTFDRKKTPKLPILHDTDSDTQSEISNIKYQT